MQEMDKSGRSPGLFSRGVPLLALLGVLFFTAGLPRPAYAAASCGHRPASEILMIPRYAREQNTLSHTKLASGASYLCTSSYVNP